jgi:periplasmic divalent cation tolerance protein
MSDVAMCYVTFSDREEAERIAHAVVEERLAGCVNVMAPCTSVYRWEGEVAQGEEVPALFKTRPCLIDRLRQRIAALHSYDLPVIESWNATADSAVGYWLAGETGE